MIKKWHIVMLSLVLIITTAFVSCASADKAKDGDTVKVAYILTSEDGTIIDSSSESEPFEFTLGNNEVITGFEGAVKGMKVGETKTVTLSPDEAYGQHRDDLIREIDRSQLPANVVPEVGKLIEVHLTDGSVKKYPIIAITDTTVSIDINHPLAGKTLTFEITLVEIVAKE